MTNLSSVPMGSKLLTDSHADESADPQRRVAARDAHRSRELARGHRLLRELGEPVDVLLHPGEALLDGRRHRRRGRLLAQLGQLVA